MMIASEFIGDSTLVPVGFSFVVLVVWAVGTSIRQRSSCDPTNSRSAVAASFLGDPCRGCGPVIWNDQRWVKPLDFVDGVKK